MLSVSSKSVKNMISMIILLENAMTVVRRGVGNACSSSIAPFAINTSARSALYSETKLNAGTVVGTIAFNHRGHSL